MKIFSIGDKVKHIRDDRGKNTVYGIVCGTLDQYGLYPVDWMEFGVIRYNNEDLVLVMPSSEMDFQDKIKDRLGD